MPTSMIILTGCTFAVMTLLMFWRPHQVNEAVPAVAGAALMLLIGSVPLSDLGQILQTVSGAAVTIIATIVMANVLESLAFFSWIADRLAVRARGSGLRLFWYTNLLCFMMTLFFNNDGSILITTPILLILLKQLGLKTHQQIPYLISGALVATASSAPIGVSNIVNLIALKVVGMDLYMQTAMMFVPATLGLLLMVLLLLAVFHHDIPKQLRPLPPHIAMRLTAPKQKETSRYMVKIFLFVMLVRASLFAGSYFGIPVEVMAAAGAILLLIWRWIYVKIPPRDLWHKTPWHIFAFAFGMYVQIYALHNIGLTQLIIDHLQPLMLDNRLDAVLIMGGLTTAMSSLFNNHPALMIGTLALTGMSLDALTMQLAYMAGVIGSDVGSLLVPIGTLATLIWMHLLRRSQVKFSWWSYLRVTMLVIPPTLIFTLVCLQVWVEWLFVK
ncbi:arsenite efflux membrane protein ArsB [Tumebacillus sp. BK434]|uniref:ArsB/NhaD family transporter n=1 Tax=Tumebacillus sp. BK434 TaxID=2512169 RepID=UPI00104457F6|nr:ArsB/NhaD family transporter [Tumebacillus sp. BK434]TCP59179.1 arsenite efflux membrane protein ArsB [Tumebacillus sp. BK434]